MGVQITLGSVYGPEEPLHIAFHIAFVWFDFIETWAEWVVFFDDEFELG